MYIVFSCYNYYPGGGVRDIKKVIKLQKDLKSELLELGEDDSNRYDEWQVLDIGSCKCLVSNNLTNLIKKIDAGQWKDVEDYT